MLHLSRHCVLRLASGTRLVAVNQSLASCSYSTGADGSGDSSEPSDGQAASVGTGNDKSVVTQKEQPVKATATGVRHKSLDSKLKVSKAAAEISPGDIPRQQSLSATLLGRLSQMDETDFEDESDEYVHEVLHKMDVHDDANMAVARPFREFGQVLDVKRQPRGGRRDRDDPRQPVLRQKPLGRQLLQSDDRLDIFTKTDRQPSEAVTENSYWEQLHEKRLSLMRKAGGPRNGWEQMIEWTEQGKMYPYPMDNEYKLGSEENVSFAEHILIERELGELGFPSSGPIRDFMELVCIGLSKNPYMTIEEKHGHLKWYKEFFDAERIKSIDKLHQEQQQRAAV